MKVIRIATVPQSLNGLLRGQLKFLNQYFEVVGITSKGPALNEVREREGIKVIPINMERRISPLKDVVSLIKLYRIFKIEKPVIVHSITPKAGLLAMLAGRLAGVPIRMHTFTGLIFPTRTGLMRKVLVNMDRLLCWAATHVYPEGQGVRNDLIRFSITSKPVKVIANGNVNGIDINYFDPGNVSKVKKKTIREELGIGEHDFIFLFVGRVVADKGVNELVRAFNIVQQRAKDCHLIIVGGHEKNLDPLRPETYKLITEHKHIHAVGYKTDVINYFGLADVLTFPSYREGFPNVVMQAAAMQLNCIVSDVNGCNEIIKDGINGWIIPPKNYERLMECMEWCMENKKESIKMGLRGRPFVEANYDNQLVWDHILQEYREALATIESH